MTEGVFCHEPDLDLPRAGLCGRSPPRIQARPNGGLELIVQIDANTFQSLRENDPISVAVPSEAQQIRPSKVTVQLGNSPPPRILPPQTSPPPSSPLRAAAAPATAPDVRASRIPNPSVASATAELPLPSGGGPSLVPADGQGPVRRCAAVGSDRRAADDQRAVARRRRSAGHCLGASRRPARRRPLQQFPAGIGQRHRQGTARERRRADRAHSDHHRPGRVQRLCRLALSRRAAALSGAIGADVRAGRAGWTDVISVLHSTIDRWVGWHVPELAKGVFPCLPRPSQAQGRATQPHYSSSFNGLIQILRYRTAELWYCSTSGPVGSKESYRATSRCRVVPSEAL